MRRSFAALTVGALTIVMLVASYLLFQYTSEKAGGAKGYRVHALFHNALGIYDKTRVLSAGLRVGQVEERVLDQESGKAKVFLLVDPEIRLYENAVVGKKSASLLGEYYLDIDPGRPFEMKDGKQVEVPRLKEGDRIKNVTEPAEMGEIMDSVNTILPVLKTILDDVKGLTGGPIKDIANNTNQLIERNSIIVERLLGRMDEIAATVEGITKSEADDVKVALHNVREITEGIKGLVGTTQGQVSGAGEDLRSSLQLLQRGTQKLHRSVDCLDKSLNHVEKITGKIADGEGTVGHLITDDTVAKNLDSITDDANSLLHGVTRLQTIVGMRTEFNYLAGTFKNYLSVTLMPRPDKFYLIEVVDDPRGYRTQSQVYQDSSQTGQNLTKTITTTEQLRLTFQFGKRIGPFVGRFGVKESTGGVGADLYLFDDRLMLSADVFDMRSNQYPRAVGRASVAVYKRMVYLVGGVDDVFNYVRTQGAAGGFFDWFLGAQLVFNDEDLKSLLLFGGGSAASSASK
jgi:phospholipid/cholesterol/gamma-HCH transport system substrate-binding protein